MTVYLQLAKFTSKGAQSIMREGFAVRERESHRTIEALGGKLLTWQLVAEGDWDLVAIFDLPDTYEAGMVLGSFQHTADGFVDHQRFLRLVDATDVDAAMAAIGPDDS